MPRGVEQEAFVVPYLGRSAGVVFWEPRRPTRAATAPAPGRPGGLDGVAGPGRRQEYHLAVYAPGELSSGEMAALRTCYASSVGEALRHGRHPAGGSWAARWWWLGGLAAAVLLGVRALEFGPGYAWLALAGALTALPLGTGWPFPPRRVAVARRLARRVAVLEPVPGEDARAQERLAGLWRVARRLQGPPPQQLRELEAYCREHAWREAAEFYAARREELERDRRRGWRERLAAGLRPLVSRRVYYASMELRGW